MLSKIIILLVLVCLAFSRNLQATASEPYETPSFIDEVNSAIQAIQTGDMTKTLDLLLNV